MNLSLTSTEHLSSEYHAELIVEPAEEAAYYPPLPSFDFSSPRTVASFDARQGSQLGQSNFFRDARWSPDGSSLLTIGDDRTVRLFTLPTELLTLTLPTRSISPPLSLSPTLVLPQQSAIYSSLWYPSASKQDEATFCFLVAGEGLPIRLVDAGDGRIRASYTIFDHRERFVAPNSMAFNNDGSKFYCGFQDAIEIFDITRPGASGHRQHMSPSKKNKSGMKGIISALAFSPDPSTSLYAAGSFSRSLALYTEKTGAKQILTFRGLDGAGVTSLKFNPYNPTILYSASRRSSCLVQSFDIRFPKKPLEAFARPEGEDGKGTNQRMGFEVDLWGRYLVGGDKNGKVSFFDISPESNTTLEGEWVQGEKKAGFVLEAGSDAIPSSTLHPYLPLLATVSGSRHLTSASSSSSSSSSSDSSSSSSDNDLSDASDEEEEEVASQLKASVAGSVKTKDPFGKGDGVRKGENVVAKGLGRGALGEGGRRDFRPKEAILRVWDFTGRPGCGEEGGEASGDLAEGEGAEGVEGEQVAVGEDMV